MIKTATIQNLKTKVVDFFEFAKDIWLFVAPGANLALAFYCIATGNFPLLVVSTISLFASIVSWGRLWG